MVGYRKRISRDRHGKWQNTVLMERRSASDDFEVKGVKVRNGNNNHVK